ALPLMEALDLGGDDGLGIDGLTAALFLVGGGYLLQIVNIVDEDAVELIHLRINVARNGDIDEEHGPVAAAMQKSLAMLAAEDGVRRACRCDHDVGIAGDL